jgi:hypothetical protein
VSEHVTLVVIGVVLCALGLAMLRSSQRVESSILQKNFGFNIGSISTQTNTAGDRAGNDKKAQPNWIGLVIAVIGLLTAAIGLFKALSGT